MKLGTRIFISGLMASIVATGTVIIIGLLIDVFTGDWEKGVKIFCIIFSAIIEAFFVIMFTLVMKAVWKED